MTITRKPHKISKRIAVAIAVLALAAALIAGTVKWFTPVGYSAGSQRHIPVQPQSRGGAPVAGPLKKF